MSAYVENEVSLAYDVGSAAWVFDLDLWGVCGQGTDEGAALRQLRRQLGRRTRIDVVERLRGDELVFARDRRPATAQERRRTLEILAAVRRETIALLRGCTAEELDSVDHRRALPSFASWRTLREMGWHVADCECRYYLPAVGLPAKPPESDLLAELVAAETYVRRHVEAIAADVVSVHDGEVWTTVKLLRRLAWHERGELAAMRRMLVRLRGER